MDKAVIFIVDDSPPIKRLLTAELELGCGFTVALKAGSLKEALKMVPQAKKLGVNIAVLDGSLDFRGNTEDGHTIAKALRREIPGIKIISFSFSKTPITWGDYNIDKARGVQRIASCIRSI